MSETNGYNLIKGWQLALSIILILVGIGVTYGVATSNIGNLETRVGKIEIWKDTHNKDVELIRLEMERKLTEIQLNQKVMMEKLGIKYQHVE